MGRFDTRRVQMYFAAVNRFGREPPRFVKPSKPKPSIQAMFHYNIPMKTFRERLKEDAQALEGAGLLKRELVIGSAQGPVITLADGREMINLCANN